MIRGSIDKLIRHLAEKQTPVIASVMINPKGWYDARKVYHDEELRAECIANPKICGGHGILITGYDSSKKVFMFKNSWGKQWGTDGYGAISFETLQKFAVPVYVSPEISDSFVPPPFTKNSPVKLESSSQTAALSDEQSLRVQLSAVLSHPQYSIRHGVQLVKASKSQKSDIPLVMSYSKFQKFNRFIIGADKDLFAEEST